MMASSSITCFKMSQTPLDDILRHNLVNQNFLFGHSKRPSMQQQFYLYFYIPPGFYLKIGFTFPSHIKCSMSIQYLVPLSEINLVEMHYICLSQCLWLLTTQCEDSYFKIKAHCHCTWVQDWIRRVGHCNCIWIWTGH